MHNNNTYVYILKNIIKDIIFNRDYRLHYILDIYIYIYIYIYIHIYIYIYYKMKTVNKGK